MALITKGDFIDIYIKFKQRNFSFLLSKINSNPSKRTKSAFNETSLKVSNWWIIPQIRHRWNLKITGNKNREYEEYFCSKFFPENKKLKFISIGSGVCSHEIKIAKLKPEWEIHCVDFSEKLLNEAKNEAKKNGVKNMFFYAENILESKFYKRQKFDIVFFHASLHHFDKINEFFLHHIKPLLNNQGYLIINEFVGNNRLQFKQFQISKINHAIDLIPKCYRKIFKTNFYKNKFYGSGLVRMYIADPSECADSENILPTIHENFKIIEEKPYGGNLLMSALKDISHHFIESDNHKTKILEELFNLEDKFLEKNKSDFIFGVYQKID